MKDVRRSFILVILITTFLLTLLSLHNVPWEAEEDFFILPTLIGIREEDERSKIPTEIYDLKASEEGKTIYVTHGGTSYRYGPSIIEYEDGSMDAWFSSPGNNSTEWDWIRYRHSEDGANWGKESIVLRPTPNSKDQCSVCDPGVIWFDGYYYMGYTSTSDYALKGFNNSGFVARSKSPEGPYEKWNGNGWGGKPEPILLYEGDPNGWGIGEISFVICGDELYVYYTYYDHSGGLIYLKKADLSENWPSTLEDRGVVLRISTEDSFDFVYDENLDRFMAFSMKNYLSEASSLVMFVSGNGETLFTEAADTKRQIRDYAHSIGIAKSVSGHIDSSKEQLVGYAYGPNWGRWSTVFQKIAITHEVRYE